LRVTGDERDVSRFVKRAICNRLCGGSNEVEAVFDFNQFIPMPEELQGTESGSVVDDGMALHGYIKVNEFLPDSGIHYVGKDKALGRMLSFHWAKEAGITTWQDIEADIRKRHPDAANKGRKAIENYEKYKAIDWYSWAVSHWGTKWGAYDYVERERSDGVFECTFDTAWSDPEPIYEAMEIRFPTLKFEVWWFDEGWNHAGERTRVPNKDAEIIALDGPDPESDPKSLELHIKVYGESPHMEEEMLS